MDTDVTEYTSRNFEGTEDGRKEMIEWLEFQYSEYLKEGKDKLKIHYTK